MLDDIYGEKSIKDGNAAPVFMLVNAVEVEGLAVN